MTVKKKMFIYDMHSVCWVKLSIRLTKNKNGLLKIIQFKII